MWFALLCSVDVWKFVDVDSKIVANYFKKGRGDITKFASIKDSSVQLCNFYLTNSHVEFIGRQTNEVAHELAKATTSIPSFRIFYEIPTCITDLILG
ncbi:hypothetical protein MTR_4g098670 [Medicago truncatula]|uniref:Uncharacterized protein n=1 Tax=Medicago truncatula TaxID=3880 RepID=G7JGI2_MEDTR|nr:hypothetical protein MTR_4g098670 [Medicago truncatula]